MGDKEKIHEEDVKVLEFILDKLLDKIDSGFEDFSCDVSNHLEEFIWDGGKPHDSAFNMLVKEYIVRLSCAPYYRINFTPACGTVSINLENCKREFDVGFGPKNKDIKIKIMKLYHKIKLWQDIEVPRQEREDFINEVAKAFPDMFDHMILGDTNGGDEEEEK